MFYLSLAWRNLWRNHRRTLITVSSVSFAVLLSLFVGSLNRGVHNQMIDNMARFHTGFMQLQDRHYKDEASLDNSLAFTADLQAQLQQQLPPGSFLVPRLETFMLAGGEQQVRGALVLGVDASAEQRLNGLQQRLVSGEFFQPGDGRVVLSEGLARRLQLSAGDELVLLGQGRYSMTASGLFEVAGLIRHPLRELDNQLVYLSLPDAQYLLSAEGQLTSLLITPAEVSLIDPLAQVLRTQLDVSLYRVETWRELLPELLEAIRFDNAQQVFMLGILYMVIGFGLFGTVLMMTLERNREFGVLLSLGMQRWQLGLVLFLETLLICLLGVVGGFLLGVPLIYWFYFNPIPLSGDMADLVEEFGMGLEPMLSFSAELDIFYTQGLVIFMLALLIGLYPLLRVMRLDILAASRS